MGRGGKRPGAGRPPILDWEARGWIGAECERLLRKEAVEQSECKFRDQNPTIDNIYDMFADNEALSIEDRKNENVLKELKASRDDLVSELGATSFPVPIKRCYGVRTDILDKVRSEAEKRYRQELKGRKLTHRFVERCLEEFRAVRARLASEEEPRGPDYTAGLDATTNRALAGAFGPDYRAADIASCKAHHLLHLQGIGPGHIAQIERWLSRFGLKLSEP